MLSSPSQTTLLYIKLFDIEGLGGRLDNRLCGRNNQLSKHRTDDPRPHLRENPVFQAESDIFKAKATAIFVLAQRRLYCRDCP